MRVKKTISMILFIFIVMSIVPVPLDAFAEANLFTSSIEYNGHYYALSKKGHGFTRDEAEAYCESLGGHLAILNNIEENNAVFDWLLEKDERHVYFGMYKCNGKWIDILGNPLSFFNWAGYEPNNQGGVEDQVCFYYCWDGKWNDGRWSNFYCFICEWESEWEYRNKTMLHEWYFDAETTRLACHTCSKAYDLSSELGFKFGRDTFSFPHSAVKDYWVSKTGLSYVTPALKLDIIPLVSNAAGYGINYLDNKKKEREEYGIWGGSCYGIASMNSQFMTYLSTKLYGADTTSGLSISEANFFDLNNDTRLKDSINIMMYSQASIRNLIDFDFIANLDSSTINKRLVDTAKNVKNGGFPPIVKYNNHTVNVIGIMDDDFDDKYYVIPIYDCNNNIKSPEPKAIAVSRDYKEALICEIDKNNGFKAIGVATIADVDTNTFFNDINFWAPGLSISPLYLVSNAFGKKQKIAKVSSFEEEKDQYTQNYIRFLLASDDALSVTGSDGTYFIYSNDKITDTNIDEVYVKPLYDFGVTAVVIPYSGASFEIESNNQYYANISYDESISVFYCEEGGTSHYDCDGEAKVNTNNTGSYFEMSSYKYDLINSTDAVGLAVCGTNSETSIDYSESEPKIESSNFDALSVKLQHNDYNLTVEELDLNTDECTNSVSIVNDEKDGGFNCDYAEEHAYDVEIIEPTCTEKGYSKFICQKCGDSFIADEIAALDHTTPDENGNCTRCSEHIKDVEPDNSQSSNICKYCGKVHTGFFGKIVQFFHNIIYFFKNLFK